AAVLAHETRGLRDDLEVVEQIDRAHVDVADVGYRHASEDPAPALCVDPARPFVLGVIARRGVADRGGPKTRARPVVLAGGERHPDEPDVRVPRRHVLDDGGAVEGAEAVPDGTLAAVRDGGCRGLTEYRRHGVLSAAALDIDLRLLQLAAVIDVHGLPLR